MFDELLQQGGLSLDRLLSFCLVAQAGGVTKAAKGEAEANAAARAQLAEMKRARNRTLLPVILPHHATAT